MVGENARPEIAAMIEHLAARWVQPDTGILSRIFPLLAAGQPVAVDSIARTVSAEVSRIENSLQQGRAGRDKQGRVIELYGLMLAPTLHRLEIKGVALYSCCGLVAQMIPRLIGEALKIESVDPTSRGLVRLTVTPDGIESVHPAQAAATLVVTEESGVMENVSASFCSHVHHFVSAQSASAFASEDSRRYVVGIDEFHDAAMRLCRRVWRC